MSAIKSLYSKFLHCKKISTDTRTIENGDLFFALKGPNFDGNKFAKSALEKGASYVVIDNEKYNTDKRCIVVDNSLKILHELANHHRNKIKGKVIAITGTNGKTTSKELIASCLASSYNVHATKGNLNNDIGLPLTILSCPIETDILILEMGANHVGEIKLLCEIGQPDFGIITNIGKAHLEGFGSYQGVINAKSEMYQYIQKKKGKLFVNKSDNLLMKLSKDIDRICYELKEETKVKTLNASIVFESHLIDSQLFGEYNRTNILLACTIADYFDVSINKLKKAVKSYTPNNRSQLIRTKKNTLFLDAYNSNPSSLRAALESFENLEMSNTTIIIGDMLELGDDSIKEHQLIISFLEKFSSNIILVGTEFEKCQHQFIQFKNSNELRNYLLRKPITNNNILLKGSRGIGLEKIIDTL